MLVVVQKSKLLILKNWLYQKEVYERSQGEFYCERCYKLIHYNQNTKVDISESEFIENIKK